MKEHLLQIIGKARDTMLSYEPGLVAYDNADGILDSAAALARLDSGSPRTSSEIAERVAEVRAEVKQRYSCTPVL